jgi:hypothetical protein
MIIEKDNRKWDITITKNHNHCDFVSYPANYRACNHPDVENSGETGCSMDICPIKRNILADIINDLTLALELWLSGYEFDDEDPIKLRGLLDHACTLIGKPRNMEELANMCSLDGSCVQINHPTPSRRT